jgi:hypothetical protein
MNGRITSEQSSMKKSGEIRLRKQLGCSNKIATAILFPYEVFTLSGCARQKRSFTRTPGASTGASRLLPSKTNAARVWVVYQKNMRKTILLAGCALLLGTTVIASDFAADPLSFRNPQQDLFDNLSEMIRETKELQSCEKQQEEALQRFLEVGLSLNAAALMAHNQYPCD